MNVERLHSVIAMIQADLDESEVESTLRGLTDDLGTLAAQPQNETIQRQVATQRQQLADELSNSSVNAISPLWHQVLEELGLDELLGDRLASRVEAAFETNELTPAAAHDALGALLAEFEQAVVAIDGAISSFEALEIGTEDVAPGEVELAILIPRPAVREEMVALGEEVRLLGRQLGVFVELATGSREPVKLRAISSSDFSFYAEMVPEAAALFAVAIERLLAFYKNLLEVRQKRADLKRLGVPDESLEGIGQHLQAEMVEEISRVSEMTIASIDDAEKRMGDRLNELGTELEHTLNALANRIDKGYHFDVIAGELEAAEDDEDDEDNEDTQTPAEIAIAKIIELRPSLEYLRLEGDPVLSLPEGNEQESTEEE